MDLLQSHEKENFGLIIYSGFVIYDLQVKDVEFSCLLWFEPSMLYLACNLCCLIGKDLNYASTNYFIFLEKIMFIVLWVDLFVICTSVDGTSDIWNHELGIIVLLENM